jgi:hypothetical protein
MIPGFSGSLSTFTDSVIHTVIFEFVSNFATGADSTWRLWLEIEEGRSRQSANREEVKAGSEKSEVCRAEAFPQEGDGRLCWLRTGPLFTLLGGCREAGISGKISRSHKRRSHTFSSHRYNFTEITITTPRLTRILYRLNGGGISLGGDVV